MSSLPRLRTWMRVQLSPLCRASLSLAALACSLSAGAPRVAPNSHSLASRDGQEQEEARPALSQYLREIPALEDVAGVALDDKGDVWALEPRLGRLLRIAPDGERTVLVDGLRNPRDVERDANGDLWVSESWGRGIVHLRADGRVVASFGDQVLLRAGGLALSAERVFVTDTGRHRVEVFERSGKHLFGFGGHGSRPGQLIEPADLDVDGEGRIYVADAGNSRLQVFSAEGEYLTGWGDWGPYPGLFYAPTGIVVRDGEVYVCDRGNHRVQAFTPAGKLLNSFGLHALRPREGAGFLHYPSALALSPNGEWAALGEPLVDRVQIFSRTGGSAEDEVRRQTQLLAKSSAHYGMELELAGPYLVSGEPESHSILVFENTGDEPRRITRISGLGRKPGLLTGVAGMHFERSARDLWVCDPILRRLSLFRLSGKEEDEVAFDPRLAKFVKSIDLARLHELSLAKELALVPEVVALDRDAAGRFYLCDRRNGCVIVLSRELEVVEVFGLGALVDPTGICVAEDASACYVADPARSVLRFSGEEHTATTVVRAGPGETMLAPHDLALNADGRLFATDCALQRVFVFSPAGELENSWGGAGLGRGQFYKPRGIEFDGRGRLTVVDHANHRLQSFDASGQYLGVFGPRLYTYEARFPGRAPQND